MGRTVTYNKDILGNKNNFRGGSIVPQQRREDYGIKAIEKNRKIVENKRQEWINLARKSNEILYIFEKEFGQYRQPYNIDVMKGKTRSQKEVKAMKNIISEVEWRLKWPNIPNKASDKRLERNLTTLGFDGSQIKDIQNSWG